MEKEGLTDKAHEITFKGFKSAMKHPTLYKILRQGGGRLAQKPLLRGGSPRPIPAVVSGWTDTRALPPLAKKPFRELWEEGI